METNLSTFIKIGGFVYIYDNLGNMIDWIRISHIASDGSYFRAGQRAKYVFYTNVSATGQVFIKSNVPGYKAEKYYIYKDTAEMDYNILLIKREVISKINKITDCIFLQKLYAQSKTLLRSSGTRNSTEGEVNESHHEA